MKNNFWRKTAAILCAAVFLFAFAACGDEKASAVRNMSDSFAVKTAQNGMMDGDMTEEAVPAESGQTEKSEKPQYEGNRKIIRNAALELETEKYAETIKILAGAEIIISSEDNVGKALVYMYVYIIYICAEKKV